MAGMKDIAKACGVSIKTVSNVVNHHPNVSEAVRRKVLEAIGETGYIPNIQARSLVLKTPGAASQLGYRIGCILKSSADKYDDPYMRMRFKGVEEELRRQRHQFTFIETEEDLADDPLRLNWFLSPQNTDGIISFVGPASRIFPQLSKLPFILMNQNDGYDCVMTGKIEGISLLVRHLLEMGHRQIGFAGIADEGRFLLYLSELGRNGLETRKDWQFLAGFGFDGGYSAGEAFKRLKKRPTAVLCASDTTAIGFMHSLFEGGLRVPEDVSVTGYDGIPEGKLIYPPLTTVDVDAKGLGSLAVRAILERLRDPSQGVCSRTLPVKLVSRLSVKRLN